MNEKRHPKVKASHLVREAYLYVRQATWSRTAHETTSLI